MGECGKRFPKTDGQLIELVLMNTKTHYDVLCSSFRANWMSRKEDDKDFYFDTFLLMKLSLMPTWTCNGLTGCHWCHQVPLAVPWTPYRVVLCLETPCTQLTRSLYPQDWILMPPPCWRGWRPWRCSWSIDGQWRIPRWVGEALMTHYVVIHALMVSWYPMRRPNYPTYDVMMDLDPWGSPTVVDVVEEAYEASCLLKNPW